MTQKAGARHNQTDQAKLNKWLKRAAELKDDLEALGAMIEEMGDESNSLKAVGETDDELRVANYIVLFGGRDLEGVGSSRVNPDGSKGEFFTKATRFESEYTQRGKLDIDWEHGRAKKVDGLGKDDILGYVDWATKRIDETGVWVERVLNRRQKYIQWIEQLVKARMLGNSTETVPGKAIKKKANGEITEYELYRDSLTVQPMEPRMITANSLSALKALGIELTNNTDESTEQPEAEGTGESNPEAAKGAAVATNQPTLKGITNMDEKELAKLVADNVAAAMKAQKDADAAEATRKSELDAAKEEGRKAAKAEFEAENAKRNRLPIGKAPVQTSFADTRKFDSLSAPDLAMAMTVLRSAQKSNVNGATGYSEAAAKALAIKIAEDKDGTAAAEARQSMKAAGFEPEDFLNATKANELDYTTQAGFGDEWAGVVYSRNLWNVVRAPASIVGQLPTIEIPEGAESVIVPLEGADPTFYKVAQTTDTNATTGIPDATVPGSKLATDNRTVTSAKGGARVGYSGEMTEDSVVPFAGQLRVQMETAAKEQIEHAVIDGDTQTSSANINTAAGSLTNNLFLLFDGFRKSPLVTTTANSRSAGGAFADTDFLETARLMGAAGLLGADRQKTAFIVDANVQWKLQQILSVKTRDVFTQASLENGMLEQIWAYKVYTSYFMHFASAKRMALTTGKISASDGSNTTGSILAVRWDQWLFAYKRRITMEVTRYPRSDSSEIVALFRIGLKQRDTEASAITYNVGV